MWLIWEPVLLPCLLLLGPLKHLQALFYEEHFSQGQQRSSGPLPGGGVVPLITQALPPEGCSVLHGKPCHASASLCAWSRQWRPPSEQHIGQLQPDQDVTESLRAGLSSVTIMRLRSSEAENTFMSDAAVAALLLFRHSERCFLHIRNVVLVRCCHLAVTSHGALLLQPQIYLIFTVIFCFSCAKTLP